MLNFTGAITGTMLTALIETVKHGGNTIEDLINLDGDII